MKMNWLLLAALIAATASVAPQASAQNLLLNPSFEDAPVDPGNQFGDAALNWPKFQFTSAIVHDNSMPQDGAFAIAISGGSASSGASGTFQKILGHSEGTEFTFSIWAKAGALPIDTDDPSGGANMQIEWHSDVGGGSSEFGQAQLDLGPLLTTQYQQFTLTATSPVGTGHVRPVLVHRHNDQTVFFDNASFTAIPEPATIFLAMVGTLGVAVLGRRSRR